jgi:hypothetical protein
VLIVFVDMFCPLVYVDAHVEDLKPKSIRPDDFSNRLSGMRAICLLFHDYTLSYAKYGHGNNKYDTRSPQS